MIFTHPEHCRTGDLQDLTHTNGGIGWYNGIRWVYGWEHANDFHLLAGEKLLEMPWRNEEQAVMQKGHAHTHTHQWIYITYYCYVCVYNYSQYIYIYIHTREICIYIYTYVHIDTYACISIYRIYDLYFYICIVTYVYYINTYTYIIIYTCAYIACVYISYRCTCTVADMQADDLACTLLEEGGADLLGIETGDPQRHSDNLRWVSIWIS